MTHATCLAAAAEEALDLNTLPDVERRHPLGSAKLVTHLQQQRGARLEVKKEVTANNIPRARPRKDAAATAGLTKSVAKVTHNGEQVHPQLTSTATLPRVYPMTK